MNDEQELPFKIYSNPIGTQYDVYLTDSVENASSDYNDLLHFLNNDAAEHDTVNIHLANFGGAVHSGLRMGHAIKNCKGTTIIYAEAPCYSMGAILALTGDALCMQPGTFLMFHNYTTLNEGKAAEVFKSVVEYQVHFEKSLKYFCAPFLTKREINALIRDEDVYIHSDQTDLLARYKRHFKRMVI